LHDVYLQLAGKLAGGRKTRRATVVVVRYCSTPVRASEWVVIVYAGYLFVCAQVTPAGTGGRNRVRAECLLTALVVSVVAWSWPATPPHVVGAVRNWAPLAYVLALYWMPSHLLLPIDARAQRRLTDFDDRWAVHLIAAAARAPRWFVELLELAYLLCYPLLPAGFLVLALLTSDDRATERYWTAVVIAAALSYGWLPWIRTHPPRQFEAAIPGPSSAIRRLNDLVLHNASVQLNTFPSGHTATSTAAALAVVAGSAGAGAFFCVMLVLIAAACVVRRYHFLADVLTGAIAGAVGFAASLAI
jgi:PAP2 superfamily